MNNPEANTFTLINARIVTPGRTIASGSIAVRGGRILAISEGTTDTPAQAAGETIDAGGRWALPGFIDVHVHGGGGHDFMDADADGIDAIARYHASHGTTSMLATSLTAPRERLTDMLAAADAYRKTDMPFARIVGVHLEGPFVSVKWRGAQNPAYILPPQPDWLKQWIARFPGTIKLLTLAPEHPEAAEFIRLLVANGIVPACGHTDADYAQLTAAADIGLRHSVHTYNAMTPLHHREPGTVGAVLTDDRIMAEVIADGHHVHPAAMKLLVRAKGVDRVILVTDAIGAAGMPDGVYELGGLSVALRDGVARLNNNDSNPSLAGSTLTMIGAVRNMVNKVGVTLEEASRMASANPARQLGIDGDTGTLEPGKSADLLLLDERLELDAVWIGGRRPAL